MNATMNQATLTNGGIAFDLLNLTSNELLKLAFQEQKLTEPIGACGTVCDGTCQTCDEHMKQLSEFFCVKILEEQEAKWQKELDDLTEQVELDVDGYCDCQECRGSNTDYWDYGDEYSYESEYDSETGMDWNESGYFD
jgi:hypothetical protein